jgi:coiled-coil domain-containing protein 12
MSASLDAAAAARKARLSQLKSLKRKVDPSGPSGPADVPADDDVPSVSTLAIKETKEKDSTEKDVSHLLSGRNYDKEERAPKMGYASNPAEGKETAEAIAARIAEETRQKRLEAEKEDKPIDLFNLQPKRPNWDLKRDVDKKLEVLGQRTDIAIAKLVKKRIEEEKAKKEATGEEDEDKVDINLAKMVERREKEKSDDDEEEDEDEE